MKITEKTSIPLFAVFGSIPIVVGGIFWLTAISFKGDQALAANEKQDQYIKEIIGDVKVIKETVIRMEERQRKGQRHENQ